ncbi:MAG: thiazole synthase [Pseudomonadota bacterium]
MPDATGPSTTDVSTSGPSTADAGATGPGNTGPGATGPGTTGPGTGGPCTGGPDARGDSAAGDPLLLYGTPVVSRLMLGTALYPSPAVMAAAFRRSGAAIATVSLRREGAPGADGARAGQAFWDLIRGLGVAVLPNTAGCHSVKEAVTTAHMAREVFGTPWIKLEVIGRTDTLQPDPFALVEAARILADDGFQVFPYTTEDLVLAEKLVEAGCEVLMPWGAPIGSGLGLTNLYGLRAIRATFPDVPLVVDAGIGLPSQAAQALELGFDAVLLNTAVAKAGDPPAMAEAFAAAVRAGRLAYLADPMAPRDMAEPSTPVIGQAFLA